VAEDSTGHKRTEREEEVKGRGESGGSFFRPMPALNFLIHNYKSRKKQAMIIIRESRKDTHVFNTTAKCRIRICACWTFVRYSHTLLSLQCGSNFSFTAVGML